MRRYVGSMTNAQGTTQQRLQAVRILSGALIGGLVIFAVVAVVALGTGEYTSPVEAAALFGINVLAFVVAEVVGYRTEAVRPDADPESALRTGLEALQQTTILRFAITEAPAILALVWAFSTGSAWPYLIGAFWSLLCMAWHVWPSRRVATRLERSLDREGGRSGLVAALSGSSGPSTPGYQHF